MDRNIFYGGRMPSWTRHVTKLITVRYWIALVLIALFVTASYFAMRQAIERERGGFEFVRLAAEQRVASQRICFLSYALVEATDEDDLQYYRNTLRRAVKSMAQRHEILSLRNHPERVPRRIRQLLRDIYLTGPQPFNQEVDNFIENASVVVSARQNELRTSMPELIKNNYAGSRQIMQTHRLISNLLVKESTGAVDRVLMFGTVLWVLTLILLAVEIPLIFRPMARRAARSLNIMELARRKAQHDTAAAHAAREAQASFIRTMSHELRTPLNAILGLAQLMKMGAQTKKWREYVNDIQQAGQHLLGLINDILEFSRLEAKQVSMESERTSLQELLEQTVSLLRPLAAEKGLKLDYRMDQTLAESYWTDGPRIRQILLNLVGNAIKFTSEGGIEIRAGYSGAAGITADIVRFEVEDSGIGVAPGVQERIFQEFQQADASLARKYGGSGLGLAISSRLVRLMNGKIGVESIESNGSIFWFELPLDRMSALLRQAQEEPALPERVPMKSPLNLLVVIRDPAVREAVANNLRNRGHEVRTVVTGKDALLAAMESPPDAILIDLSLRERDRLSAIRAVRAIRALPGPAAGVFIVALGADTVQVGTGFIIDAGADICLEWPLDIDLLERYLMELDDGPVHARIA